MKKTIKFLGFGLLATLSLASCSDDFLEEKRNYDNANKDIYNYYSGANGRLNDLYAWSLPTAGDISWKNPSMGNADMTAKATEEYSGFSDLVNPEIELTSMSSTNQVPDFFMSQQNNIQESVYGRIRNINDCIEGIQGGSLTDEEKNILLGQAYFLRAWCYFNLVKWYGGVPILDKVLEPTASSFTPRSSAKKCIEFILNDLDNAAKMLAKKTMSGGWTGSDYGRVTTGTALALKGRVLVWWCSPLFNRANDQKRWADAYAMMKQELDSITSCGYGLYQTTNNVNGSDFAKQFLTSDVNPEAVFVTLYNNITGDGLDNQKNNRWECDIRPANTGGGGKGAGVMLVNMFPMKDGKIPAGTGTYSNLETSSIDYDANYPFMDRDPRFYRTFAFPGFRWAYSGDASQKDPNNPSDGKNFVIWNYVWYTSLNDQGNPESGNSYGADNLLGSKSAIYVRKKSDDLDVNPSPLYQYVAIDTKGSAPYYSAAPLIELRFAEVLLNLAEVACMAGDLSEAVKYLQQIRARAGYTAENKYGLQDNLVSDKAACMSAILYERQIEFAYEGKRFDDLRRWMLYDGGKDLPEGAPESWRLSNEWADGTCEWLGFTPLNGQRRENIEFRTADKYGVGGTTFDSDPLLKGGGVRCEGVDVRKEDLDTQLQTLKTWYQDNLVVSEKRGDAWDSQHNLLYMNFRPKYYFLGLCSGAQNANKGLPQTIGWQDYNNGGANGTFDPLAEEVVAE
ncbi:MAG: RagB/SusD family nutrient uptake outer membrane protein [Prevotella sp.]|nr:RagB/SusD family nutrient uptake outer membrane protein [Prevotella sp.]